MPGPALSRAIRDTPLLGRLIRVYEERLTPRGRFLLWTFAAAALVGLDTRRSQVYTLFALAAGLLVPALLLGLRAAPGVSLACAIPERATAGVPLLLRARVASASRATDDLRLSFPRPSSGAEFLHIEPAERYLGARPGAVTEATFTLTPARRGRYALRGPSLRAVDPFRFASGRAVHVPGQTLVVYPRYWAMDEFMVPAGRRYQPGGIPLASSTGDAIEFVGTREYREGDPVKNIHWRSWARRGEPVVKEYQEEYFSRLALILDTFLPKRPRPGDAAAFEAAISTLASIADHFSRSEYVVDILAAGPDLYEVSAGRSLAYLDNILDVLACLEPCRDPPFATIGPHLFEKLGQITAVVAVVLDWDVAREDFLRRVRSLGASVRVILVRDGEPSRPFGAAGDEMEISRMSTADVERALRG